MPLAVAVWLAALAGVLRLFGRRRVALCLLWVAFVIAYLGALPPVADALLAPLEWQYPPLPDDQPLPQLDAIVVLGSGYMPRRNIPITAAIEDEGLARIAEGVRQQLRLKSPRLIVSGGGAPGITPSALGYARFAKEFGVPASELVLLEKPRDTNQESQAIAALLGNRRFLLVTSASHMPRAMRLMERVGAHPIPVPTAHRTSKGGRPLWHNLVPTGGALERTERALHEYLGLTALALQLD